MVKEYFLGVFAPVENVVHVIWLKLHNWLFFDSKVKSKNFLSTPERSPAQLRAVHLLTLGQLVNNVRFGSQLIVQMIRLGVGFIEQVMGSHQLNSKENHQLNSKPNYF